MVADDGVNRFIGGEAELARPPGMKIARPAAKLGEAGSAGDDDFHAAPGDPGRTGSGSADLI